MTSEKFDDELMRELRQLPLLTPPEGRAERVRARCHAAMARRQLQMDRSTRRAHFIRRVLEPALVGALSVIYLAAAILEALRLYAIRVP